MNGRVGGRKIVKDREYKTEKSAESQLPGACLYPQRDAMNPEVKQKRAERYGQYHDACSPMGRGSADTTGSSGCVC